MKCWLSKVGVIALRNVVGKEVVETMSPEVGRKIVAVRR